MPCVGRQSVSWSRAQLHQILPSDPQNPCLKKAKLEPDVSGPEFLQGKQAGTGQCAESFLGLSLLHSDHEAPGAVLEWSHCSGAGCRFCHLVAFLGRFLLVFLIVPPTALEWPLRVGWAVPNVHFLTLPSQQQCGWQVLLLPHFTKRRGHPKETKHHAQA